MTTTSLDDLQDLTSPHDAAGRAFLERANRFLLNVTEPAIASVAVRNGYTEDEHKLGWSLVGKAAGVGRPFAHYLSAAEQKLLAGNASMKATIKELDAFENLWFPRVRNAIRRFAAAEKRDALEKAFFDNLEQQVEGPGVVGSVSLLLERLEGLKTNQEPGAAAAYKALVDKGLTSEVLAATGTTLTQARNAAGQNAPRVTEAEQRAAAKAQLDAFAELKLWFIDWADALRPVMSYHQQVRLGLTQRKGGRKGGPAEATPGVDDVG